ncbi:MAG TPA: DUF1573 domain-containing protein [Flavobacteriales bacterium]
MSNGIKVGLLVVIAGALGFLGYSQFKKGGSRSEITTRPVTEVSANSAATAATKSPVESANTAAQNRPKTTVKFDKTVHDFGDINNKDQVECIFKITNTGNEPLVIENAQGSCGCTVPDYPKDPIPSGETRDIKVKFNPAGKKDKQTKTVTITANTDPVQSILTIQAFVKAE